MENSYIYKSQFDSKQIATQDSHMGDSEIVEPFYGIDDLLKFFYYNVYHQRAIKLKSRVLSNIADGNLAEYLPKGHLAKRLLYNFVLNLECFGTAFLEKAGVGNSFNLFNIPTPNARLDTNNQIFHRTNASHDYKPIEGFVAKYDSLASQVYGEPDYLTILDQIDVTKKCDIYNKAFFDNGAKPGYAIMFENSSPNDEQLNVFNKFFSSHYKGYNNAHKTLVLHTGKNLEGDNAKIKIEKLNDINDLSFEKLKSVNRDEIIAAHGVPPRLVGVVSAGTLGGSGELIGQLHSFNELEIKPKIELIEEFFDSIGVKLKLRKFDVTNFKDDSNLATKLVEAGILTIPEARDLLEIS